MDRLLDLIPRWKPFTVAVVGDFMLDEQVFGDAERLSADAPVPVLLVRERRENPGGAANVCLDLAALRGRVLAFGVIGDDANGSRLRAALDRAGVDATGLIVDPTRPTTVKQNLIGLAQARHPQKMFRVDMESREPLNADASARLLDALVASLPNVDAVVIEDYAKGVCDASTSTRVIAAARSAGKPVFVDPARLDSYQRYAGATAITPNRTEAELATGMQAGDSTDRHKALARRLSEQLNIEAVVLTLDRHGALLLERGQNAEAIPTVARQVYDVTGAGDMFLAGLTAARVNGAAWADAVRFANAAAGLEVEVFGVVPIPLEQIERELLARSGRLPTKLRTIEQAAAEARDVRRRGGKVVFTNGCFDILHAGHASLLTRAAALGEHLVVGLNTDESVRRLKGPDRPLNAQADRAHVLGALGAVGAVVFFDEPTPLSLIEAIRPEILVKGADYTRERVVGGDLVESWGGRVVLLDLVEGKSTTGLIQRVRQG